MASEKNKTAVRISGILLLFAVAAVLSLACARFATHVFSFSSNFQTGLTLGLPTLVSAIVAHPFAIDWSNRTIDAVAACTFAIPVILAFATLSKGMKLDNEDTGSEHGDDRLATDRERSATLDKKNFFNNFWYTEHSGLAFQAHSKATKAILDGKNQNCITLGISGLGKTHNLVKPDMMQSIGTALPVRKYGIRNIPEHLKLTYFYKFSHMLISLFGNMKRLKDEGMKEEKNESFEIDSNAHVQEENPAATEEVDIQSGIAFLHRQAEEGSYEEIPEDAEIEHPGQPIEPESGESTPWAEAAHRLTALRQIYMDSYDGTFGTAAERAARKAAAKKVIGDGFDVFNTDPKGDNVRDMGWMFLEAGYKLKVFNTIDFLDGLHYNPLAYIKTLWVDIKHPELLECSIAANGPSRPSEENFNHMKDDRISPSDVITVAEPRAVSNPMFGVSASFDLSTERAGMDDVPATSLTFRELDAKLKGMEPSDPGFETMRKQRDLKWMETEMGAYCTPKAPDDGKEYREGEAQVARVEGRGCEQVFKTIQAFSYRRTSGEARFELKNNSAQFIDVDVEIDIDPALVFDQGNSITCTNGWLEWPTDSAGSPSQAGTIVWHVENAAPRKANGIPIPEVLIFACHIQPTQVPDGVDLTKTVDCLVANLRGTDAKSNGSEDPFWEDTKRLAFMAMIAFLFERYGERYHTIPEAMRLLNMALADSGDPTEISPLAVLMKEWEYGKIYEDSMPEGPNPDRIMVRGGRWRKADNLPHSRNDSIALHCFHAFTSGAPETVQSVIISCKACLVNLITDEVKEMLSYDEMELDTLGDPNQKQVIFCVTKDTDSPFDFLTALIVYQAIDLAQDKAYKKFGGRLPRHVRFVLDEVANLGKIPILVRALAVVRSRNISISMFLQSKAQLALVYGEKEADVIFDNCSTILYLGAQTESTLDEISKMVGTETVQTRTFQRSFPASGMIASTSEQIGSNERRVKSTSQLRHMEKGFMVAFIFGQHAIYDHKFKTTQHPYYAYIDPTSTRSWLQPLAVHAERFDYKKYLGGRRRSA